jgi:LemA protein
LSASQIAFSILLAMLLFWAVGAYNRLIGLRNVIGRTFALVDVQIKRRHQLITQLAQAARPQASQETDTLDAAEAASQQAASALELARAHPCAHRVVTSLSMAEHVLDTARARLLDTIESTPGLNNIPGLQTLSVELNATENKLAYAREGFDQAVIDYNDAIRQFPTQLLANLYGFKEAAPLLARPPTPFRNT